MAHIRLAFLAMIFGVLFSFPSPARAQISADDLRAEVETWRNWMAATHPDLTHSASEQAIDTAFEQLSEGLTGEYGIRAAWHVLATVNPVLNDAHTGLRLPETAYEAAIESGAAPFTLPVRVSGDRLFVAPSVAETSQFRAGQEILSVNGDCVDTLIATLVPRMRGETRRLRERVLSLRFSVALWAVQGDRENHVVRLTGDDDPIAIAIDPARDTASPDRGLFALEIRDEIAILRIDTFDPAREEEFAGFLSESFARIADAGADRLIVDVRENGGGGRQLSDRLFAYLTTERYSPISAVKARITADNQTLIPGSEIGQIIETPFAQWVEPPSELLHRFEGETTILIGPASYSQAIAFGVIAQDFDIAAIAGSPTEGSANQTGQVQRHILPETGLIVQAPIYIFTRPSGTTGSSPLIPDRIVPGTGEEQLANLIASLRE